MISQPRSSLLHVSVLVDRDTQYAVSTHHGQVWVGTERVGDADVVISGDADALERLAATLMLTAAEMREAALVEALGPSGQPATTAGAAA